MTRRCIICKRRYGFAVNEKNRKIEHTKKRLELWEKHVNKKLEYYDSICEKHFDEKFIKRIQVTVREDGTVLYKPRKRPCLDWDAVPNLNRKDNEDSCEESMDCVENPNSLEKNALCKAQSQNLLTENEMKYANYKNAIKHNKLYENVLSLKPNLKKIMKYLHENPIPKGWSWLSNCKEIQFIYINSVTLKKKCIVTINENLSVAISTVDKKIALKTYTEEIRALADIIPLLEKIQNIRICEGVDSQHKRSVNCTGVLPQKSNANLLKTFTCDSCKQMMNEEKKFEKSSIRIGKSELNNLQEQCEMYKLREKKMSKCMKEHVKMHLDDIIRNELPEFQAELFLACLNAKNSTNNGFVYSVNFLNECIVMYATSFQLYNYINERKILPLPNEDILQNYLDQHCPIQS